MSRHAPDYGVRYKDNNTIWINKPKKHYIITTDQKTFYVDRRNLDYKKTIENMKRAGYTNINISFVGYNVTWSAH